MALRHCNFICAIVHVETYAYTCATTDLHWGNSLNELCVDKMVEGNLSLDN